MFRRYDTDNSGTLEWNEVTALLTDVFRILGVDRKVTNDDVKSFSDTVDINGDGKISKTELYNIFRMMASQKKRK